MSISEAIQSAKDGAASRTLYKSVFEWFDSLSASEQLELQEVIHERNVSTRALFNSLKVHANVPFGDNAFYFFVNYIRSGE